MFLLHFFRFNYQLIWVQQDQCAYISFPQTFVEIDLLPFIITDDFKPPQNINPLEILIPYFDIITCHNNFVVKHSETIDSRPYATIPSIETHITPDTR